jgi:hypothetical protein
MPGESSSSPDNSHSLPELFPGATIYITVSEQPARLDPVAAEIAPLENANLTWTDSHVLLCALALIEIEGQTCLEHPN